MALIEFENKPSTDTPINATNLNNNFNELDGKIDDTYDNLKAYSLYSNGSGNNGSITLSDNVTNYSYIDIFGGANGVFTSQRVMNPNSQKFGINLNYNSGGSLIILLSTYEINNDTISPKLSECGYSIITTSSTAQFHNDNTNYFSVTDIVGYK